mgnify:CR=1 FL=1
MSLLFLSGLHNLLDAYRVLVLLLHQRAQAQPQEHREPHPPVAGELAGAVLSVVDVECPDLIHQVTRDPEQRGVEGPGLPSLQAAVGQAREHRRGEAGQAHGGLLPKLDGGGLDTQDDIVIFVLIILVLVSYISLI